MHQTDVIATAAAAKEVHREELAKTKGQIP
jgi:hypothetical protein